MNDAKLFFSMKRVFYSLETEYKAVKSEEGMYRKKKLQNQ